MLDQDNGRRRKANRSQAQLHNIRASEYTSEPVSDSALNSLHHFHDVKVKKKFLKQQPLGSVTQVNQVSFIKLNDLKAGNSSNVCVGDQALNVSSQQLGQQVQKSICLLEKKRRTNQDLRNDFSTRRSSDR